MPATGNKKFSEMLPRADLAGVVHLPQNARTAIVDAARDLAYFYAEVDLSEVRTKDAFLAALSEALSFPPWFGANWDALADCLADMSWSNADGYVLILLGADKFQAHARDDFLTALTVLHDVAQTWAADGIPFWAFVDLLADGIPLLRDLSADQ